MVSSRGWRGGGGRGGCAPSYSVDSCLQWSNGVWWVEVLSYHVFLSSSGMYVSQSHLHDYQHFADLGTVMVWCGLDGGGGEWRSLCGSSFSQVRLTLPVAVSPEPVPDTFRWL